MIPHYTLDSSFYIIYSHFYSLSGKALEVILHWSTETGNSLVDKSR